MLKYILKLLTLIVISVTLSPQFVFGQDKVIIAVLKSDDLTSTKRTLGGAKKVIRKKYAQTEYVEFLITNNSDQNLIIIDSLKNINPTVILTIGSSATQIAKDNFESTPIVFSSVKYPLLSGFVNSLTSPGSNITGASIDIPVNIQFEKFKQIVPQLKKVGVLYTKNTASLIPQAKIIAKRQNLELVAIKINNEKELPKAIDSLARVVQGIWSLADPNLFDPKSTRYILLNTLKKGIPFMGFSRYVVESGALFALDFDYKAVGSQAGRIINRIIAGQKPGNIRVTSADVIWFHYNEKTANRIKIKIPDELAAVAKEVYR
jgi:putative ABC transport system substrate-binding protein